MKNKEIIEKALNEFAERNQYSNWENVIKDKQSLSFDAKGFEEVIGDMLEKALSLKEEEVEITDFNRDMSEKERQYYGKEFDDEGNKEIIEKVLKSIWTIHSDDLKSMKKYYEDFKPRILTDLVEVRECLEEALQLKEEEIKKKIDELENPYPKDVFKWDNKEKLKFNRGRFNQHCFEIWENCKDKLKNSIREEN